MSISALTLMTLGFIFLIGFIADMIGRNTPVPRVSALLVFGICIGPAGFDLLPPSANTWMPVVSDMALAIVGFLLGNSLKLADLRKSGKTVIVISVLVTLVTAVVLTGGMWLIGCSIPLALLFGGIAPATDPAATVDVIRESKAGGEFADTLLKITAIDDAWGLMIFSLMLSLAQFELLESGAGNLLLFGFWEVGLSILLGIALGVPMSFLTGRIQPGEPSLVEGVGMVFICSGMALWLGASYLLSPMVMGAVVANLAKHHERPFYAIEGIEWLVVVVFFIFAGVNIRSDLLLENGVLIASYILFRVVSRFAGAVLGAVLAGKTKSFGQWMGMALMPQAGIALGMALTAAHRFDAFEVVVSVVVVTTIFFEVAGPICTRIALNRGRAAERT